MHSVLTLQPLCSLYGQTGFVADMLHNLLGVELPAWILRPNSHCKCKFADVVRCESALNVILPKLQQVHTSAATQGSGYSMVHL